MTTNSRSEGPLRVAIAGGGTGGHLFPGLALAEQIKRRDPNATVSFFGCVGGIEERVLPAHPYPLNLLPSPRRRGGRIRGALRSLSTLAAAAWQARRLLKDGEFDAVVGVGGYASAAPILAARWLGIPAVLLEQNAIPGRTNRFLSHFAAEVHVQFASAGDDFAAPSFPSGNPVRRAVLDLLPVRRKRAVPGRNVLVIGGSQGAHTVNQAVLAALPRLEARLSGAGGPPVRIVHLTGRAEFGLCRAAHATSPLSAGVIAFCERMEKLYRHADLVVCRAGATTLAEVAALGLPSVMIPYPCAADDHQTANAREVEAAGAGVTIHESELRARLAGTIADLLLAPARLGAMAAASARLGRPHAADTIARRLETLAGRPAIADTEIVRPNFRAGRAA